MNSPLYTLVIPTLNSRDSLLRCLEAALSSRNIDEPEIFVIDNGGRDGSSDAVRASFPTVRVIRNETNQGFAKAVNQGIRESRGRLVCLLNDDAVLEPDTLRRLADELDREPQVGIMGPQLVHADGSLQNSIDNFPGLADQFLNKSLLRALFPRRYPSKRQAYEAPVEVESIIGACMVIRRELVEKIGGLDERYFVFLEETDYCLRAREAGFRTVFFPGAKVRHDQGMTGTKRAAHRTKVEYWRSMMAFLKRHRGAPIAGLFAIGLFFKTLLQVLVALVVAAATLGFVRRRLMVQGWVFLWLILLCPASMGLKHARL